MEAAVTHFEDSRHRTADDLRLVIERFDPSASRAQRPLLYAHGFGQNRLSWRSAAQHLAERGFSGLSFDARGHGDSDWCAHGNYDLEQFKLDLIELAGTLNPKPMLVGASMGGLLGLLAEGEVGHVFSALVLVDVTPRWESAGVERILNFMQAHPDGFSTLDEAQHAITRYLPHRENKSPERLKQALRATDDGRFRWHWDPRLLEHINQASERYIPRLLKAAQSVKVPTLLLSGGLSDVVSPRTIEEFLSLVPHATHIQIPKATHMVVGDRNDAFVEAIAGQLPHLVSAS
jgi:pimeloyl-ACP methyl ester carboxylesterase